MGARVVLITVAVAALEACGGAAQDTVEVTRAAAAVRAAEEAGARDAPRAVSSLELAEHELRRARTQLGVGDVAGACGLADRACADAGLARMLAIEAATRDAAQRSEDFAQDLSRALDAKSTKRAP